MVIGIDASRANHDKKTGVEWYAWHVIEQLKTQSAKFKTDQDVQFILYSDEPLRGELAKLSAGWTSKVLHWPPKRLWTQVRLSWEMLVHPPDVLWIPAHVFPIIHPKKTVMTVHDVAALTFPQSYNWFERWYSVWSAKYAVRKLWKVIVPSQFVKEEVGKLEIRNWKLGNEEIAKLGNIFVVNHGYDKRYRQINDKEKIKEVLKKYNIQKPFLLSMSRLEEKKNTVRIIEAFNTLRNQSKSIVNCQLSIVQLVLIGKPGHGYEKVRQAIESSPYKKDIICPGWVSEEDAPYIMNAAEVFVFSSLYEGFGIPVLESMACGTPVVAGKGSCLEEVGGDAAVYVDPLSVADIIKGIELVSAEVQAREERIRQGLERVKLFSWEKCAEDTYRILVED